MRLRVIERFDWGGRRYYPGHILEIGDTHRKLGGLMRGGHVVYDCSIPCGEDRYGVPIKPNVENMGREISR